jgi:hypothetical protein
MSEVTTVPVLEIARTFFDACETLDFEGDRIHHMTKIWHSGITLRQLGWG